METIVRALRDLGVKDTIIDRLDANLIAKSEEVANRPQAPLRQLTHDELDALETRIRNPVGGRKSGLSLNHVIGCPLDCAYCIRHSFNNYQMKEPRLIIDDERAVDKLVNSPYFRRHETPIQIFNYATDMMVPRVRPHLRASLKALDALGLKNDVLLITRYMVSPSDCHFLNSLENLRITLLITYSGIADERIEPIDNQIPINSLLVAYAMAKKYRVILYWRPIVPGLNDSQEEVDFVLNGLAQSCHAVVFTGLFFKSEMIDYYRENDIPLPYGDAHRRKIMPKISEDRVLSSILGSQSEGRIFRKTSCGVRFVHGLPDYNGHIVIESNGKKEICDICPAEQVRRCREAHKVPSRQQVQDVLVRLGAGHLEFEVLADTGVVMMQPLGADSEKIRYGLQHALGTQVHAADYSHHPGRHGRAEEGWKTHPARSEVDIAYADAQRRLRDLQIPDELGYEP